MASVLDRFLPGRQRNRLRGRALAFVIVVLVHLLLVLVLVFLAPPTPKKRNDNTANAMVLLPDAEPQRARKAAARAKPVASKPLSTTPIPPPLKPVPPSKPVIFGDLAYNAVDIAKLPSAAPASTADAGTGQDGDTAQGVGIGPGGVTLYKAEWAREPTNAELRFYMPKNQPDNSWGMIACRTIERNLVEDCVALDDYPHGSGIARGLVNAAWQFKVRPPRINGQPEIGSWVRIRIEFSSKNRDD
jgi:cbb3-type cytochrome oxidase subunit 3